MTCVQASPAFPARLGRMSNSRSAAAVTAPELPRGESGGRMRGTERTFGMKDLGFESGTEACHFRRLVQRELPREVFHDIRFAVRRVQRDTARAEQDADTLGAQRLDAALELRAAGERFAHERQHDDRDSEAGLLGENAERVGVREAERPLVDGVERRRGDDDRVGNA